MIKFGLMTAGTLAALLWAGAAAAVPLTCKAVVSSPGGGRLEVTKIDPAPASAAFPFASPGALGSTWSPPSSDGTVSLEMEYDGQSLDSPRLIAINVEFTKDEDADPELFKVRLSANGMPAVVLEGAGINVVLHTFSDDFRWDHSADRDMGQALDRGLSVKVEVLKSDKLVQTEMFNGTQMNLVVLGDPKLVASAIIDTTDVAARHALFAQAQHLIETSDPSVCKPIS